MEVTIKIKHRGEQRTATINVVGEAATPEMLCALIDDLRAAAQAAWGVNVSSDAEDAEDADPEEADDV